VRIAYADPPYPGESYFYKEHPDYAGEVDHAELIARLVAEYPDGWALSTKAPALRDLLPLCPPRARVMPWVKPFASFKPGINPAYCWEPVIVFGGRKRTRQEKTVRDWVAANITIGKGLAGVKPYEVCAWLFEVLGMGPEDELVDLFPGSGAVTVAWETWKAGGPLPKSRRDEDRSANAKENSK
jgi:hypothetical protein